MVNPLLSLQGGYSLQERLRGRRDLLNQAKIVVSFLHKKKLEPKVEKLRHMMLEFMKPNINIKCELPHEVLQS